MYRRALKYLRTDSDLDYIVGCLQHSPYSQLRLSKLLQQRAAFPLLCTDNKQLHSSADSSSTKAMLIVLKHTAPEKLITVPPFCSKTNNLKRVRDFNPLVRFHFCFSELKTFLEGLRVPRLRPCQFPTEITSCDEMTEL